MKKLLSVLSSTLQGGLRGGLLILALLATTSLWAYDFQSGDLYYNITSDSTVAVTYQEYNSSSNYASIYTVTVPETVTYNGTTYSVTSIGDLAFLECSSLTSVTIGESVTSIGDYAFYNCTSLTSVTIPNSVTSIGYSAFYNCTSLTSVSIGESVTSIGDYAFSRCSSLTSVTIPNSVTSIGEEAFKWCSSLTSVTIGESVTSIGARAFSSCSSLTSITIPESVTSIGESAFSSCSSLTSITIPNSVTSIGSNAFYGCSSLTSITIPNSVTSIGKSAFEDCSSLTSITIPNSVTSIGSYAFYNCSSLTSVTIPEGVTSIGWYAFYGCSSLSSITLPNSVTSIGDYAFYDCSSLTSITIPESVTSIDSSTFIGCYFLKENFINNSSLDAKANNYWGAQFGNEEINGLLISDNTIIRCRSYITSVTIPNSITRIGDKAFKNCFSLSSITIPYGVISIGGSAFNNCTSLTSVTIPNSVKAIVTGAFRNCSALTSITIPEGIRIVTNGTFAGCSSLTSVTIPNSVYTIGRSAFYGCSSLTSITIPNSVSDIESRAFENCSSLASFTIHENLQIESDIFEGCSSLTAINVDSNHPYYSSVDGVLFNKDRTELKKYPLGKSRSEYTIPNSVTSIGNYAFSGCSSLTSITLPNSVTSIGNLAFSNCSSLTSITLPNSVTSIGYYAFENCSSLTSITLPNSVTSIESYAFYNCSSLTSVTIPEGVTSIGVAAFYNCFSLTSVTIPNSVTSIGDFAFLYCNSLSSATIGNSVTNIGDGAFYCNLEEIYCYPTTPPAVTAKTTFWNYNATLYVPCDSKEAYEEHPVFGEFKNIKGIDDCGGGFVTTHIHDTICQGEVYEFGEYICDTTGTYTAIIGDVKTFLYLTVLPSSIDTITVEACDSYEWHGKVYTESGVYTYRDPYNPCVIEELQLTIIDTPTPPSEPQDTTIYLPTVYETICEGETVYWWGMYCTEGGIYTYEEIVEDENYIYHYIHPLELQVLPSSNDTIVVEAYDSYEWHGEVYTESGTYIYEEHCYQEILHLTIIDTPTPPSEPQDTTIYHPTEYVAICEGDDFYWRGRQITEAGTHTDHEIVEDENYTYHHIYTLELSLLLSGEIIAFPTTEVTICENELPYVWNINRHKWEVVGAGTYTQEEILDCGGAIYTLELTVIPSEKVVLVEEAYDSYEWHGKVYTESGVYTYRDPYNPCVIEELYLTIIDTPTPPEPQDTTIYHPTEYATICEGETYIWMGLPYTEVGTYTYEEIVEDENYIYHYIHTLELQVIAPPEPDTIVVEAYDSYEWHGVVYTESGVYLYEEYCYQEILHLTIIPSEDKEYVYEHHNYLVCDADIFVDPITGSTHVISSLIPFSLTWSDTIIGTNIDTIHTFNITPIVAPEPLTEDILYAIGAVPELVAGEMVNTMGTTEPIMWYYQMNDKDDIADVIGVEWVAGHDVVLNTEQTTHTMVLEVWDECYNTRSMEFTFPVSKKDSEPQDTTIYITHTAEMVTICEGETYIWMGKTYTEAGTYRREEIVEDENYIYHNIYTLELTVIPPETVVLVEEAYDSFEWHGIVYTESGTYTYQYECTTEVLYLTIIPSEDNQGEVVVEPSTNSVTITWQKEDDADTYIIVIKQGDKVVCTLIFDAEGNLVSVNYLPGRESNKHGIQHAGLTSDSFQYTITGLTPSTDYTYTVTATDDSDNTISSYSGEFTTHHATSVENTNSQSPTIDCQKILYKDHIYILRDGKTYTIMGQEI